jgi:hypothetical protein
MDLVDVARAWGRRAFKITEPMWKAIGRFVRLIKAILVTMLPHGWATNDEGEAPWVGFAAATIATVLIVGVVLGVTSAILFVNDLTGGGEQAASVVPAAPAGPNAPAAPAEANAPAAPPEANAPAAPAEANPPAAPGIITVRGTLDVSLYTNSGMNVVDNSIILELPRDGGPVTGSALVRLDNFPIGAILEQIYEGMGGSPADYPNLQGCTSVVTVEADDIAGSYSPQDSKITGGATWGGKVEDRPCLSPLPPGLTSDEAVEKTTLTLDATFDSREVVGAFSNPSGEEQSFQATVQ